MIRIKFIYALQSGTGAHPYSVGKLDTADLEGAE